MNRIFSASPLRKDTNKLALIDPSARLDDVKPDAKYPSSTWIITTSDEDRDREIVLPRGCLKYLDSYRRNPVVFWDHQKEPLPIGKSVSPDGNLSWEIRDTYIKAVCWHQLHTQIGREVYDLVRQKFLNAASIGFIPHDSETSRTGARIWTEWEPTEWSIVGLGANPSATQQKHLSRQVLRGLSASTAEERVAAMLDAGEALINRHFNRSLEAQICDAENRVLAMRRRKDATGRMSDTHGDRLVAIRNGLTTMEGDEDLAQQPKLREALRGYEQELRRIHLANSVDDSTARAPGAMSAVHANDLVRISDGLKDLADHPAIIRMDPKRAALLHFRHELLSILGDVAGSSLEERAAS